MAVTIYATVEELREALDIETMSDAFLESKLEACSRLIDSMTGRFFGQTDAATVRYVSARARSARLEVPDLVSVAELANDSYGNRTYSEVWAGTDYDLEPFNAAADLMPYTAISTAPNGRYSFAPDARGVRITGVWGFPAVPADVKEATILQAVRLIKRKDAPFGVMGNNELGQVQTISKRDPDVQALVSRWLRISVSLV